MKKYFRMSRDGSDKPVAVQVAMDVVLGDALLELVDAGIGEDAHFRGSWADIDDDDIEAALGSPMLQAQLIEYVRLPIIERMKKALAGRKEEATRWPAC